MRNEILAKHPSARLRVIVVWFSMLAGDSRSTVDRRLLDDQRVTNFWDEHKVAGPWFAQHVPQSRGLEILPITWDAYLLYGPSASWDSVPGPLISVGRTVIDNTQHLADGVAPFLRS